MNRLLSSIGLLVILATGMVAQIDERARGIELYQAGNYAESISVLTKVVEADPTDKVAWTYLGGSLFHTGKMDEALEAFRKPEGGPKYEPKYDREFKIVRRPHTDYTPAARDNRVIGTVVTVVEFRADKKIGFVVPIRRLALGLTENSIKSIKETKFTPAVKDGKPITVIRMLSTSFNIN